MKNMVFAICITVAVTACGGSSSSARIPAEPPVQLQPGKYLFAAVYENNAWAKTKKGFVIKGNGDLYQFDLSDAAAALPATAQASETELTRYFEAARFEFVESLSPEQLNSLWQQSRQLSNNTLGKEQSNCRDAGTFRYLLFQPAGQQQYQQTLIYQTGDFRREQQDSNAGPVKDYLLKQAIKLKIAVVLDPEGNNWCSGL